MTFKRLNIESRPQLNGKYTLRLEFGTEVREFPDVTESELNQLARGVTFGPETEYEMARQLNVLRNESLENDNTGGS
jgi:hypothetical protein